MTCEEIRDMYLLAAQVRKIPDLDPRREEAETVLAGMTRRYLAENMPRPGEKPAERPPAWTEVLQYVAALFAQLDAVDPSGAEQRKACWKIISEGVAGWNKKPAGPEAKETGPEE